MHRGTYREEKLIAALRPFAMVAVHMPVEAMEKDDFVAVDDEHPDIMLRARDFQYAFEIVTRMDPAFTTGGPRRITLLERTFGNPRWGWLAYTLLGLTGGFVSARAHEWAASMSEVMARLIQA